MIQVFLQVFIQAVIMFAAAGTLRWRDAWVFTGAYLLMIVVNSFFMFRLNPEVIAERGRGSASANMKKWDKIVGVGFGVCFFIAIFLVAGLDERFNWTESVALPIQMAAFLAWALSSALFAWAMYSNAYFSTVVRIQDDRGHAVCDRGPYRFVRHPGYVGASIQALATALMLRSLWALLPAALATLLLVVRTALEDRTLQDELPGYREYAQRVRYRLLPGVW
jgi:protein-S-isoprenylcysteine O-methyltransferase Ste14